MSVAERQIQLAAVVLSLRDEVKALRSGASAAKNFKIPAAMKVSLYLVTKLQHVLIFSKDFIDKQSFIILMRPFLAQYTDREDDGLDDIDEPGPKEVLWVSFNFIFFFSVT